MKRVFLGIKLNTELESKIETFKKKAGLKQLPIKLVEPENNHIAIKFLDELNNEQIVVLSELITNTLIGFKSFEVTIDDLLIFPNLTNPRVLALKLISSNLEGLAKKIFKEFESLKFITPDDRKYTPHITLGRFKSQLTQEDQTKIASLEFKDSFMVDDIHLFESQLTTTGPIYSLLKTFELR